MGRSTQQQCREREARRRVFDRTEVVGRDAPVRFGGKSRARTPSTGVIEPLSEARLVSTTWYPERHGVDLAIQLTAQLLPVHPETARRLEQHRRRRVSRVGGAPDDHRIATE